MRNTKNKWWDQWNKAVEDLFKDLYRIGGKKCQKKKKNI